MSQASGSIGSRIVQQLGSKDFRNYLMSFYVLTQLLMTLSHRPLSHRPALLGPSRQLGHPSRRHRRSEEGPRVHIWQHDPCPLRLLGSVYALCNGRPTPELSSICLPFRERGCAADARISICQLLLKKVPPELSEFVINMMILYRINDYQTRQNS
ncbi:hypothetical protein BC937DRAFT_92979 [Endogone sp. FLAS-F59071]|nr:hypothetical protein BC937DRAFT_92979 [Endogone sp. FLAS-F59071]|eukprot:RUS15034.1 hypothetical protein BC937DRAFT_92979 [Endogone sp. FLAS-F59071]